MVSWTFLIVVLIIFASGAVAFYTVFFRPAGEGTIPPLRERSIIDAVAEAERLGYVVQVEHVASTLPEGRVLAQTPEPGTRARKKQVIVLQVSKGGNLHAVPDVRGQTLAKAQSIIREQGFMLGDVIRIQDSSQPGGSVIAQSPASPANISVTRRIDLLVNEGGGGNVVIPDVNRMTEADARALLEGSGLTIQIVDRVYSPVMPNGLAIETRPGAGTTVKAGSSVRLKVATLDRPRGYVDSTSNSQKDVRRVTSQPQQQTPSTPAAPSRQGDNVAAKTPGQRDVFTGDGVTPTNTPITEADPNVPVIEQERRPITPASGQTRAQTPQAPTPTQTQPAPSGGSGSKTARIRYQVPPLTQPMNLRIEVTDPSGRRDVLNRQARSGENVSLQTPYNKECVIAVYLGGDLVWQERYR